jgi:hypothetical protein
MLYDSKMMKSFQQSFAFSEAPSLQAVQDAPGPGPAPVWRSAGWLGAGRRAVMNAVFTC